MRQGLSLPGDLLQDYSAGHDFDEDVVGGEVVFGEDGVGGGGEDGLHGEEKEGVAGEGLRKGLVIPDNLLDDYFALETEVSTDLTTVLTEVDFSTELDQHFDSSTEEEAAKSTSGGKSFTGNPSTSLQPSHNEQGEGKGKGVREKVKSGETETGTGEELLSQGVEGGQVGGAGAGLPIPQSLTT